MINFDDITKENINQHNSNWQQIPDSPYRILIFGGSASGRVNALFSLVSQQPHIDKIYLYLEHPYEANYQLLINKRENTGLKHLNDSKALIQFWKIEEYS